jgi:hypothetical protein
MLTKLGAGLVAKAATPSSGLVQRPASVSKRGTERELGVAAFGRAQKKARRTGGLFQTS